MLLKRLAIWVVVAWCLFLALHWAEAQSTDIQPMPTAAVYREVASLHAQLSSYAETIAQLEDQILALNKEKTDLQSKLEKYEKAASASTVPVPAP